MSSAHLAISLGQGFSLLVSLGVRVAILVVVGTVVKRHRPDAHGALMLWAALELLAALVLPAVGFGSTVLGGGDLDAMMYRQTANIVGGALLHGGLTVLLVRGLVKLAQPPKPVDVPADGPYR